MHHTNYHHGRHGYVGQPGIRPCWCCCCCLLCDACCCNKSADYTPIPDAAPAPVPVASPGPAPAPYYPPVATSISPVPVAASVPIAQPPFPVAAPLAPSAPPAADSLAAFLATARLEQYTAKLIELGAGTASDLIGLGEDDMDSIGMKKLEKQRLTKALAALVSTMLRVTRIEIELAV